MTVKNKYEIYKRAADVFGSEIDEKIFTGDVMGIYDEWKKYRNQRELRVAMDVIEEIAEVSILLDQLAMIISIDLNVFTDSILSTIEFTKCKKLEELSKRIEQEANQK